MPSVENSTLAAPAGPMHFRRATAEGAYPSRPAGLLNGGQPLVHLGHLVGQLAQYLRMLAKRRLQFINGRDGSNEPIPDRCLGHRSGNAPEQLVGIRGESLGFAFDTFEHFIGCAELSALGRRAYHTLNGLRPCGFLVG